MNEKVVEEILNWWQSYYYIEPMVIVCQICALIAGIRYYKTRNEGFLFLLYICAALTSFTLAHYVWQYLWTIEKKPEAAIVFQETKEVVFAIIEFSCFSYFMFKALKQHSRKLIKLFSVFFSLSVLLFIQKIVIGSSASEIRHFSFIVSSTEMG